MTTLTLTATALSRPAGNGKWWTDYTLPQDVTVSAIVATPEAAQELVAQFPKVAGLKAGRISGSAKGTGHVSMRAKLLNDGINGGRNETGLLRLQRLLAAAQKLGIEVEYSRPFANSYPTLEAFEEAVA